jgi:IS30 family transposase
LGQLTEAELDQVADELNDRPRKRLGYHKPSERIAELCGLTGARSW